jgi:ferredoxin-NADP reductase/predicted amidohydrolase
MKLRVAAVEPLLVPGDVEGNLARTEDLAREAAAAYRPDLIVLPALLGSLPRPVDGAPFVLLRELARELGCVVAGGALLVRGGDAYRTYLAVEADGRAHLHDAAIPSPDHRGGNDDGIVAIAAWDRRRVGLVTGAEWRHAAPRLRAAQVELVLGGCGTDDAADLARLVGAPVVLAGPTRICAADGTTLASLPAGEGHVSAGVELGNHAETSLGSHPTRRPVAEVLAYRTRKALRRFPWQHVPSTEVPDEIGPRRATPRSVPATIPVVVTERRPVAADTVGLTLRAKDGSPLPTWTPGAHIDVILDEHTTRQYSLCGDPTGAAYEIAVLREPDGRGGSVRLCDTVRPGHELAIRGPRNHFGYTPGAPVLFVAGGIGITPILPMVREAVAGGADWRLIYTARTHARAAFRDELLALDPRRVELRADDTDGILPVADLVAALPCDTHVYACGPSGLLTALEEACDRRSIRLRVERFTAAIAEPAEDREFRLIAAASGVTVRVAPYETALQALQHAGVDVDTSCQNGVCGSCAVRVLDGTPDQRDTITTRRGSETTSVMMLCVSRARTDSITVEI